MPIPKLGCKRAKNHWQIHIKNENETNKMKNCQNGKKQQK
jgi:hypothetical protein